MQNIQNRTTGIRFGAVVEQAVDGRFNFFTHPNNCAVGCPIPQSVGEYQTRKQAWDMCGAVIEAKHLEPRAVTWL